MPVLRGRHLFEARDLQIIPALRDRYPYRARGIRGGAFEMPGKHGSATETRTNPFLAHFALRRIRAFLKDAGTRFRRGVRIPDAGQLRDLFGVVMTTHCPATAHAWSAWDESGLFQKTIEKEAVPWTLEDTNLRRALMVTGSYVTTGMVD